MTFKQKIKDYMKENGLTRQQAAKRFGVSVSSVGFWIDRGSTPNQNNKNKVLAVIEGSVTLEKHKPITPPSRFFRVSHAFRTLGELLEFVNQYGEGVIEEDGRMYKVSKLGK